ncbi:hypothetical protein [Mangrovibacterium marinum]|nr:hypothetical protein [Mangrovibacterium marinum]
MTSEKGILSKKEQRWLRNALDKLTFKKGLADLIDGAGYSLLISVADDYLVEKYVSDGAKNVLKEAIELGKAGDSKGLTDLLFERLSLDNDILKSFGEQAVNFILSGILEYVESIDVSDEESETED